MKFLLRSLVLLLSLQSIALASLESRRNALLEIVNEQIVEIRRLSDQISHRNSNLLIRMAELYTEKGRLLKEKENSTYLKLNVKLRQKRNKKSFFKESRRWFVRAQKICLDVLKNYRDIKNKADVYYLLAYNAKEFERNAQAKKYFKMATRFSTKSSETRLKSNLELANLYFNESKFRKAIPLFEMTLRNRAGHELHRWWTKDSFNLAWCYFRVRRFKKSISLMKKVYHQSKNPKFIDMSNMVIRDLPLFYAESGTTAEGIKFYKSIGQDIGYQLKRLGKVLVEQGKFTRAQRVITAALKHTTSDRSKIELHALRMTLYNKYFNVARHLQSSKVLMSYKRRNLLNADETDQLKIEAQTIGAKLQKQVISKTYKRIKKTRELKARQASEYFSMMAELEPSKSHEMTYYRAETFYAAFMYSEAIGTYKLSYQLAERNSNRKFMALSVDGMLACLSQRGVKRRIKELHYIFAYDAFLKSDGRSKKASKIYQKLFKIYFERRKIDETVGILNRFKANFPRDIRVQEAMITEIIEYYRKKKQFASVKNWILLVQQKKYVVSRRYAKKLQEILTSIQMNDVQNAVRKGQKKFALVNYTKIINDKGSTTKARRSALYNLGVLYHELGASEKSYSWSARAIKEMSRAEVRKYEESFLTISSELFNRTLFALSAGLSLQTFKKLCRVKSRRKGIFFKNAVVVMLADGKIDEATNVIKTGERCKLPRKYVDDAKFELLKELSSGKRWGLLKRYLSSMEKNQANRPKLIKYFNDLYVAKIGTRSVRARYYKKIFSYYKAAKRKRQNIPLESLDIIAHYMLVNLEQVKIRLRKVKLSYPEKRFHRLLKRKFLYLDQLTEQAVKVFDVGSGKGIVRSYQCLIESYTKLALDLRSFLPTKKPKEYQAAFKKNMIKISAPLLAKVGEYERGVAKQISRYKILSDQAYLYSGSKNGKLKLQYFPERFGIIMDRRGK